VALAAGFLEAAIRLPFVTVALVCPLNAGGPHKRSDGPPAAPYGFESREA
jgi:hypothetical protein